MQWDLKRGWCYLSLYVKGPDNRGTPKPPKAIDAPACCETYYHLLVTGPEISLPLYPIYNRRVEINHPKSWLTCDSPSDTNAYAVNYTDACHLRPFTTKKH